MPIQSLTLKNYRSFVDRTTIELRPLTLLFGYNNSGKSALLRALPLVVDSSFRPDLTFPPSPLHLNTPLALDSPIVRGSSFSELLSRITGHQELEIALNGYNKKEEQKSFLFKWTLRNEPQLRTHFISKFEVCLNERQFFKYELFEQSLKKGFYSTYIQHIIPSLQESGSLPEVPRQALPISYESEDFYFQRLIPSSTVKNDGYGRHLVLLVAGIIDNNPINLRWLSSIRAAPLRFNPFQGAAPNVLKSNGEGAAAILAYDSMGDRILFSKVSAWYEKHFNQKLVVEENGDLFQVMLQPVHAPYKVNIVDSGEGLIQVLPVLVAGAMASVGNIDILTIEEPESHLQPRYHAALAEYFCELASQKRPPQVLLETHSRNFLLRVQLAVAKRELDPDLVMVYWVKQFENGESIVERVNLDNLGRLLGEWDRNAFHTDVELSRQLIQAQRESP